MKISLVTAAWLAALATSVFAQDTSAQFDAADVHISPPGATPSGGFLPNGRAEFRATTLLRLISVAYSVPVDQVLGGPSWIDNDRFDVMAKGAASGSRVMLQNLLTERFGLTIQHGDKPIPVFALVMGKRGAPKEAAAGEPGCKRAVEEGIISLTCRNTTISALAGMLQGSAPAYFTHPVVDRTGLKGAYDFRLEWAGRGQLPPGPEGNNSPQSIFSVIEKQLGVRVEPQTAPVDVLTITAANRVPSANPPGVLEKLGPPPTEFEVADIHPSRPDEKEDFKLENGRIDARAIALKDLIQFACNAEDDALKGGEKWLDTERFDITAKTAPTESPDTLRVMLRSLLIERFKLKFHEDRQPVTVYALTTVKPKLRDADPATRTTCTMSIADGMRAYTCQNVSMPQFVEKLRQIPAASEYLDHPLVDLTGLNGSYDFTVTWTPRARTLGRGPQQNPAEGEASAPTGGLTLFEAIDRQLGLKLVAQKQPMPVIVIDYVERRPTEN